MGDFKLVKLIDPVSVTVVNGYVLKGVFDVSTDYAIGDAVTYLGNTYAMFANAAAGTLPTNTSYWMMVAGGTISRERKLGSNCSLTDGAVNRILTVTGTPVLITVDGTVLSQDDDWEFSGADIKFLIPVFDSQKIQLWRL